ncbi:putative fungal-specific transcription factor [Microdochium trichocladiopsis]|uniref:Fungal-specific transcription factor n=1 Tax=Microdochium trichocladiopsis TaxID=1682393 RepID=A0A9P9BPG9_9PEZI|nr:putative fungal-specific transcription factor [Microdochium trichocladiopsis]KAH7024536.1 putative fungal-specific transcription factor [Microdochium trichocladiopsis]
MTTIEPPRKLHGEPVKLLRRPRLKTYIACEACRLRKSKCDGQSPACSKCTSRGIPCVYNQQARRSSRKKFEPGPPSPAASVSFQAPTSTTALPVVLLVTPETSAATTPVSHELDYESDPNRAYCTSHGRFAGEVVAAIDARAGRTPSSISHPVPFVDADLFGPLDLEPARLLSDSAARALPSRMDAEELADIYFNYVHPLECVLDQARFFRDIEAAYCGPQSLSDTERDIRLSIMNLVFALAVQRQESIPQVTRHDQGSLYFRRAWVLLKPEIVLWQSSGSIELIQCLALMHRYLHCTSQQHRAWMASGLACRIAQGLNWPSLGSPDTERAGDLELQRQVWATCVSLDRCVAWAQGKTIAHFSAPLSNASKLKRFPASNLPQADAARAAHLRRGSELFEIGNQIQLAQMQIRSRGASDLGLPRLYQQDEYHVVAVQFDACLDKWESALPDEYKVHSLRAQEPARSRLERYMLHFRLFHTRIFMYRPILACLCSRRSQKAATLPGGKSSSLSDRLFEDCAGLCVEAAQGLAALLIETLEPGESLGLMPWWYRLYYLHIAGMTFLAAMSVPRLYTDSVAHSWRSLISALHDHEHLSAYVPQCIDTFETLAARILEPYGSTAPDDASVPFSNGDFGFVFDDNFWGAGLDFDGYSFAADDNMGNR